MLWLVLSLCSAACALISINPSTQRFVDDNGRERIFHGTNVVVKIPPYHPTTGAFDPFTSLNAQVRLPPLKFYIVFKDVAYMKEWGINAVRLGVMWPGVEPTRGQYNYTYLSIMKGIVDLLSKNGIYTLVEMHQDLFSEKFCGEGVPLWAAIPSYWAEHFLRFPEPLGSPFSDVNSSEIPLPSDCAKFSWSDYYFTVAQSTAVQNLYDNYDGLLDSFGNYWKLLASTFKDNDMVLGYELINEPWAGDIFTDPLLMVPGYADYTTLQPTYEYIHDNYIRPVDNRHIVMFEGITWDDITVGFTQCLGGDEYLNRSVYAYHLYVPPNLSPGEALAEHYREIQDLGCGWMCTESYAVKPDGALDDFDAYLQSWMQWIWKSFYPNYSGDNSIWNAQGKIDMDILGKITRTYAMAVAGHAVQMSFNATSGQFLLEYEISDSISLPTEIYLSEEFHYKNGYKVVLNPPSQVSWSSPQKNSILISKTQSTIDQTLISVLITPN